MTRSRRGTSYLNDVRVEASGDFAYLSDSGTGALVTVDLRNGTIRRRLADHPSTKGEPGLTPVIEERELRVSGGQPLQIHVDVSLWMPKENIFTTTP